MAASLAIREEGPGGHTPGPNLVLAILVGEGVGVGLSGEQCGWGWELATFYGHYVSPLWEREPWKPTEA